MHLGHHDLSAVRPRELHVGEPAGLRVLRRRRRRRRRGGGGGGDADIFKIVCCALPDCDSVSNVHSS